MRPITSVDVATGNAPKPRPALIHCVKLASRSPYLSWNERGMRRIATVSSVALLLAFATASVSAQNAAQNEIDRSQLLRQQQEQDLVNRLDDAARKSGLPAVSAEPPGSLDNWLAPPKLELPPAQLELPPAQLPSSDLRSQALYQSQQQRLLEQQMQNRSLLPPMLEQPMQEQQNQIQLQQFQREDQAERLGRDILRSSNSALSGPH